MDRKQQIADLRTQLLNCEKKLMAAIDNQQKRKDFSIETVRLISILTNKKDVIENRLNGTYTTPEGIVTMPAREVKR